MQPKKAVLNDFNKELINTWKIVKNFPDQLIEELEKLKNSYSKKEDYLDLRNKYNDSLKLKDNLTSENQIKQAAQFIFINKSCFNGLYRVNSKGKFNVPWNKSTKHKVYDKKNLLNINKFLNDSETYFYNEDFPVILEKTEAKDLVYLDPPYDLLNKTTFTSYTEKKFDSNNQEILADLFQNLDKKGCYVMLSNHKTANIWKLYQNFYIYHVPVKRLISSKKATRKTITEVLITNFSVFGQTPLLPHSLPYENLKNLILNKQHYMTLNPKWYSDLSNIKNQKILPAQKEITILKKLYKSSDIKKDLVTIIKNNPKIQKLLPLIFATRWDQFHQKMVKISASFFDKPEEFVNFLDKGHFLTIFSSQNITALDDYLWGVEVGMDTNTRKNRSGQIMQDWVKTILDDKYGIKIWEQKTINEVLSNSDFPLNYQNWDKKILKKRWDFILTTDNKFYFLECNYFDVLGSKVDAVAAQYGFFYKTMNSGKELYSNAEFIWITDGIVWQNPKHIKKYQQYVPDLIFLKELLDKEF